MEEKGKKLGLWNIIGLGLGGAIGTGIFVLLGMALPTPAAPFLWSSPLAASSCCWLTGITWQCPPCS